MVRFLHPTNERLKEAINSDNAESGKAKEPNSSNKRGSTKRRRNHNHQDQQDPETFQVPRSVTLTLESEPLSILQLQHLPYYSDLQWLIDFSLCSLIVYFATEAYFTLFPARQEIEYNLGIVWCLLALSFAL